MKHLKNFTIPGLFAIGAFVFVGCGKDKDGSGPVTITQADCTADSTKTWTGSECVTTSEVACKDFSEQSLCTTSGSGDKCSWDDGKCTVDPTFPAAVTKAECDKISTAEWTGNACKATKSVVCTDFTQQDLCTQLEGKTVACKWNDKTKCSDDETQFQCAQESDKTWTGDACKKTADVVCSNFVEQGLCITFLETSTGSECKTASSSCPSKCVWLVSSCFDKNDIHEETKEECEADSTNMWIGYTCKTKSAVICKDFTDQTVCKLDGTGAHCQWDATTKCSDSPAPQVGA